MSFSRRTFALFGHQRGEAHIPVSELLTGDYLVDGNGRVDSHTAYCVTETCGTFVP